MGGDKHVDIRRAEVCGAGFVTFGQDLGQRAVLRKRHVILPNAPTLLES